MSARASRRAAQFDFSSLTNVECLLIAQAAYEYGAGHSSWSTISKLMAKHALVSRPKNFFTPTLCSSIYENLLKEAGLERTDAAGAPKAPENLALAQKRFQSRFEELVDLIKAEEMKFKTVVKEIEEIKAGHWDSGLKNRLSGTPGSAVEGGATGATENESDAEAVSENQEGDGTPQGEEENGDDVSRPAEDEPKSDNEADAGTEDVEELLEAQSEANETENEEATRSTPSEPAEQEVEEQCESSEDEPLQVVRRSTRRKSSAASTAPPLSARGRGRRQRPPKEEESADSDAEGESEEEAAEADEETPSSPEAAKTRDGKRKATFSDDTRDVKRAREDSELPDEGEEVTNTPTRTGGRKGMQRAGTLPSTASASAGFVHTPAPTSTTEGVPNKKFQNVIGLLHQQISTHRNGTIFHHPIKPADAPGYYDIVKRPMDLKTIKQRVKDGAISNSLEFQRDVYLMFANAMMYNRPGSDVYSMAEDMMHDSELAIKNHKQTEGFRAQRS